MCLYCKLHIELDRNQAAREAGYAVGLYRLFHAEQMTKGDLLVGVPPGWPVAVRLGLRGG